jgi:hypothetical protein
MCSNRMDELAATNCYTLDLLLSMAMAYWRVGETFSEYRRQRDYRNTSLDYMCCTHEHFVSFGQHRMVYKRNYGHQRNSCDSSPDAMITETFHLSKTCNSHVHLVSNGGEAAAGGELFVCHVTEHCFHIGYMCRRSVLCPTKRSYTLTCNSLVFTS